MSDNIETIQIHGESSVDWQATAMQYMELNKQKTEAIERVRELVDRLENKEAFHQLTAYACAEEILKALDGEIGSAEPVKLEALDGEQE